MNIATTAALVMAACIFTTGCALSTDTVDIGYHSTTAATPIPGAERVTVDVQTTDSRTGNLMQVSSKKNGYGMEMAPILSSHAASDIVRDALTVELQREGFQVGPSRLTVAADVVKFHNDFKIGFFSGDAVAEISLAVQVRDGSGRILYSRTLSADGTEGGIQLANGTNAKLALERALPAVMVRLMSDQAFTRALVNAGPGV